MSAGTRRPRHQSDRDRDGGFALVESIAVLALSALVLAALLLATDLVSRNSAVAARRANDLETLATGLSALRRDLEGALWAKAGTGTQLLFQGEAGSVGLAVADDRSGRKGESLVWIETRYENGEGALVRSSAPLLPGTGGFAAANFADSALLAVGPWQYRFSYAASAPGGYGWSQVWPGGGEELPAAIRLEVMDAGGVRVVPALTVRLRVDTAGCADKGCEEEGAAPAETEQAEPQPFPLTGEEGDRL